jgi:hypothetical protein
MKSIAPVAAVIIFLFSCDYEPGGEYFVERPQPDGTGLSLDLTDTSDTLFVFGNAEIRYHSITNNKPVKWFRAYLNDEEFGVHYLEAASVFLYTFSRPDGCYSLKLEMILSSGTGSLAEIKDKEEHRVERTYVLCIDNSKPDPTEITSIQRVDGTLEIKFEKYKRRNFQRYKIFKYDYNQFEKLYYPHWVREITDQDVTSFRDSTFIGGKVKYDVSVIAASQESDVRTKEFDDPYDPSPRWEWVDNKNIKLTWPRTKYYNNFTAYKVSFSYGSGDEREFTVSNVNDTIFSLDPQLTFGGYKQIAIIAYPALVNSYYGDVYGYSNEIFLGKSFPWYAADIYEDASIYNQTLNKHFALQHADFKAKLIRINATTYDVEQGIVVDSESDIRLSNNGQYLYICRGDVFTRLDPQTFSVIGTYDVSTLFGPSGGHNWTSSVSNNNRLALTNAGGSYVLEMTDFSIIQEWPHESKSIEISATGTFVVRGPEILKWNSTQYVLAGTVGSTAQRIFIQNDDKVLLNKLDRIEVVNLNTIAVERTIALEHGYNLRYDPVSGLLGGYTDPYSSDPRRFYLYDLNSNQKIKDFSIGGGAVLMNNSLVTPGFLLPLSYYYP